MSYYSHPPSCDDSHFHSHYTLSMTFYVRHVGLTVDLIADDAATKAAAAVVAADAVVVSSARQMKTKSSMRRTMMMVE